MKFYTHQKLTLSSLTSTKSITWLCYLIGTYGLAFILAFSGIAKLVDATGLLVALQQVEFLNNKAIVLVATLLPVIELGLALALFIQLKPSVTLAASSFLFVGFLGFTIYGLVMGWNGGCGCFGGVAESDFGWGMVVRNGIFLSLSVVALAAYNKHLQKQD